KSSVLIWFMRHFARRVPSLPIDDTVTSATYIGLPALATAPGHFRLRGAHADRHQAGGLGGDVAGHRVDLRDIGGPFGLIEDRHEALVRRPSDLELTMIVKGMVSHVIAPKPADRLAVRKVQQEISHPASALPVPVVSAGKFGAVLLAVLLPLLRAAVV